jgi:adenylate kinase family enzyme
MARVYVLGGGGSGKTTLATALAARLGCPLVRLDACAWPPEGPAGGAGRVGGRRDRVVRGLAAREAWLVEGNYPGWLAEVAARAEVVVWLDVPFRVAAWRILRRHLVADLRGDNPYPGYRNLWRFLRNQRRYYADSAEAYRRRLAADPDRWRGALYGRAAVAAHAAGLGDRLLRVTGGEVEAIAGRVLSRLRSPSRPVGTSTPPGPGSGDAPVGRAPPRPPP